MKKNIKKTMPLIVFIVLELIIYSLIIFDSITNKLTIDEASIIRFFATFILCSFSCSLLFSFDVNNKKILLGTICMLGADGFLVFTDYSEYGILLFILSQICFMFYLNKKSKNIYIELIIILLVSLIISLVLYKTIEIPFIIILLALFYALISITNITSGFIISLKSRVLKDNIFLLCALILLLCCDLCIGLFELTDLSIFNSLEWIFYMPTLILVYLQQYFIAIMEAKYE